MRTREGPTVAEVREDFALDLAYNMGLGAGRSRLADCCFEHCSSTLTLMAQAAGVTVGALVNEWESGLVACRSGQAVAGERQ